MARIKIDFGLRFFFNPNGITLINFTVDTPMETVCPSIHRENNLRTDGLNVTLQLLKVLSITEYHFKLKKVMRGFLSH